MCANSSGRAALSLYVNGDHVCCEYLTVEKYRPIPDDESEVGPLRIGCAGVIGEGFQGCVRNVRYWSGARTQTDVRDAMHASTPAIVSGDGSLSNHHHHNSFNSSEISSEASSSTRHATILIGSWPLCGVDSHGTNGLRAIVGAPARYTETLDFKRRRVRVSRRLRQMGNGSAISFHSSKSDSRLKFTDNNKTISCTKNHQYQTAIAMEGYATGQHFWEIQIEKSSNGNSGTYEMFVGVGEDKMTTKNSFVGQQCSSKGRRGWGYYSRGQKYSGSGYSYGTTYGKKGDVIGVMLDMDNGTLGFTVNGKDQGIAFTTLTTSKKLYPCVSLYTNGQSVSVLSTSSGTSGRDGFFSGLEGVVERAESKISTGRGRSNSTNNNMASSIAETKDNHISTNKNNKNNNFNKNYKNGKKNKNTNSAIHPNSILQKYVTWDSIPVPYMDVAPSLQLSVHVCQPSPYYQLNERKDEQGTLYSSQGVDETLIATSMLEANETTLELGGAVGKRIIVKLLRDEDATSFKVKSIRLSLHGRPLRLIQFKNNNANTVNNATNANNSSSLVSALPILYPTNHNLRQKLYLTICQPSIQISEQLRCHAMRMLERGMNERNVKTEMLRMKDGKSGWKLQDILLQCIVQAKHSITVNSTVSLLHHFHA